MFAVDKRTTYFFLQWKHKWKQFGTKDQHEQTNKKWFRPKEENHLYREIPRAPNKRRWRQTSELLIRFGTKAVGYMVTFLLVNARYYSIFLVYPILFVCVLEVESPGSHCPISRPGVLPVRQPASIYSGGMPSRLASVSILFLINKLKCPCVATGDKCVNVFSSWSSFCLTTLLRMRAFCSCIHRNHRRPANITHDKYTAYLLCCHPRFQNVPNSYLCVHRMSKHIFCFVLFFIWCCKFIHLQPFLADYYSFNIFIW